MRETYSAEPESSHIKYIWIPDQGMTIFRIFEADSKMYLRWDLEKVKANSSFTVYQKPLKEFDWIYSRYAFQILGLKENYRRKRYQRAMNSGASKEIYDFFLKEIPKVF